MSTAPRVASAGGLFVPFEGCAMAMTWTSRLFLPVVLLAALSLSARAEVSRIEITSRDDVMGGKAWGMRGAYETLRGTVHFTVDPGNPHNRIIPNIDKAPRDSAGMVEFSSDFTILAPKDRSKANGVAFFEANNRGHRGLLFSFSRASRDNGTEAEQYGDGSLLKDGFTLVWVGWQFSLAKDKGLLTTDLPVAMENGHPIPGKVSSFGIGPPWIVTRPGPTLSMDPDLSRYPPVDLTSPTPSSPWRKVFTIRRASSRATSGSSPNWWTENRCRIRNPFI
jgi:hypothetical protein